MYVYIYMHTYIHTHIYNHIYIYILTIILARDPKHCGSNRIMYFNVDDDVNVGR